jgi:transcriptional regulator with XRE-family HTH domain
MTIPEKLALIQGSRIDSEFAKLLDIDPGTIRNVMNGGKPGFVFLYALCTKLNVNLNWFLNDQGTMYFNYAAADSSISQTSDNIFEYGLSLAEIADSFKKDIIKINNDAIAQIDKKLADLNKKLNK